MIKTKGKIKNGSNHLKRAFAFILVASLFFNMMPMYSKVQTSKAEETDVETPKTISGLGTGAIVNPSSSGGDWCIVYFGYDKNTYPFAFRVLSKSTTDFGGKTMFLDYAYRLTIMGHDSQSPYEYGENGWANSKIRQFLIDLFNNNSFFTSVQKAAVAPSTKTSPATSDVVDDYSLFQPLNNDYLFILDRSEFYNRTYGYVSNGMYTGAKRYNRQGDFCDWMLRSASKRSDGEIYYVTPNGSSLAMSVQGTSGVSPACNLYLSSIISSSLVAGTAGEQRAEYKLTLKDKDLSVSAGKITNDGNNNITIPYTITDNSTVSDPTQLSVVITDGAWTSDGWSEGASVLQYAKLNMESIASEGTGTFILDDSKISGQCGTDYHAYLLAEDVNGGYCTDYSSAPTEITINKAEAHTHMNVEEHAATSPSCEEDGNTAYWYCPGCGKYFSDSECTTEIEENSWLIPAHRHDYGEPTYKWNDICSYCVATAICNNDSSHVLEETSTNITRERIESQEGEKTKYKCTAYFENDMFETQTTTFETDYDPLETHDAESTDPNNNTASPTDEPNPTAESPTETPAGNSTAEPSDPVETPESLQTSTPDTQETNVPNAVETSSPSESLIPANTAAANTSVTTASATTPSAATASAATTSAAKVGDTFTFKKGLYKITSISEGNQTATYLKYKSDSKKATVPNTATYQEVKYKVIAVGNNALAKKKKLQNVVIGKNVKKLGSKLFNKSKKLKGIQFKTKSLTMKSVNKKAFKGVLNSNKIKVKVPKSKKSLYTKIFRKKGLGKKVIIK